MNNKNATVQERPVAEANRSVQETRVSPIPTRGFLYPQVNIIETKDGYTLEAEMPGVNKEGLEVLLEGNELTIVGRRAVEPAGLQCVYRESAQRDYRRTFELDPAIDTSKIVAKMEDGILILDLPKTEKDKPRKITVA